MIPKIIHYCWFGNKPFPSHIRQCIDSWKEKLPSYSFFLWNELNSPVDHPFCKTALRSKKYAFAADYVRLYALDAYGGVYLDTDMILVKTLDGLLDCDFFIGEEVRGRFGFGIVGSVKNSPIIKSFLQYYDSKTYNPESPPVITQVLTELFGEIKTTVPDELDLRIYSPEHFYPMPFEAKTQNFKAFLQKETIAIHLWNHSWKREEEYIHDGEFYKAFKTCLTTLRYIKSYRTSRSYYSGLAKAVVRRLLK